MKRLLSTVLSFLLIISVFVTPFNTVLAEEENSIAAVEFGNVTISNYSVAIGFSKRIYIMNSGANNEECIWTTSDESIVALAGRGRLETNEYYADISGVSEGTTTICATLGEKTYSIVVSSYMPYEGDITGQTLAPAPIYDSAGQNKKYKFNISQGENLKIIGSCGDLYKVSFIDRTPEDSEYDDEFYTLKAAVRINITNLIFDMSSTSMNVGETKELGLTVLPKLASNAVLWFSSDSSIATVENGIVTAISPGSVTIRAYSSTNDVDAVMNISVYKAATELTYSEIPNQYFCGDFIAPDVEIKDGDKTLEKGKDFDVEYNDNYNVGTASISIYFKNYYTGTHIVNFNILEQNISSVFDIENIPDQTFTGNPLNPNPTITCGGKLMVLGEHYYLDFYNNIYTGSATVIIRGKGGFVGTIEKTFNIVPLDGNDSQIKVQVSDTVFSNENKTPLVRVWHNDNRLIKGSDYTLEYSDNIKIGMGKVTIKFIGNYSGTQTKQFYIKPPKGEFLLDDKNSFDGTVNAIFLKFKSHHDDANNVKLYYELYRDGEYVSTQNSAEYDDFDLSDYEIHEYKMRMFFVDESNQKHYGEWSDPIKLGTAPNNVEIKDVKINTNNDGKTSKAVITVNGVGIHNNINVYYELWRYSANYNDIDVDWELIKSDCSTSTYTDATTVVGSRYLYEVRPYYYIENTDSNGNKYNIKIYGDLTENYFAESPLPAVTDFKVTYDARTGEAHFTWLKTVAATGYTIVAYDDDGITSTYGYDVNSTDCKYTLTCDKIVPNRIYKFRILSYNKKYDNYGNPSALVTFKSSLPKISIISLKMGSEYPLIKTDFPVSRYDLTAEYWIATSSSGPFKLSETVGANIAAVDHPLKCEYDKKYYVKVRVKYSGSSVIYGNYSDVKSIEVGPKTPTVSSIERNSADTGFNLKWTSSANAKSYLIYGSHGGGNYSQLASVSGTSTTINYSELAANAYYTFKVCAVGNYRSGLSNGAQGLTPVKSVTVSSPSEGKVNISYPGGDATSYQIGYAKDGSSYSTVTTSSTSHSFSGLTPGAKYNFYVKGFYNSIGSSPKKASCTVAKVGVSVSPGSKTVVAGDSFKLTAKVTEGGVSWSSSNTNIATVDSTGKVTTKKAGTVVITAKSTKNTSVFASCEVVVINKYKNELMNSYGFSKEESELILLVYDRIDKVYSSQTNIERAWRCSRVLSEFVYDDIKYIVNAWDDVAGTVTKKENRENYFVETLGYTKQQYAILNNALINQNNTSREKGYIDFCHMQYSLAARLAYKLGNHFFLSNFGSCIYTGNYKYYTNEEISYLAGWLGDAVLAGPFRNGTVSFGNDDYMSDLDAENIYNMILKGTSSIEAISNYYMSLSSSNTRADVFTKHISYEKARDKIFFELIDAELISLININSEDKGLVDHYTKLLNDEDYHWRIIKKDYYETYNFLYSLRDHRSELGNY